MVDELGGWLKQGYRIGIKYMNTPEKFYFITNTKPARYVHKWSKDITLDNVSGPENITKLEPGRKEVLYQTIFGIKPNVYIYTNLPADTRLGGIAEEAEARSGFREIGAITQDMSIFDAPDFVTEMFLMKDTTQEYPFLYAYNPTNRTLRPSLNFLINKCDLEEIKDLSLIERMKRREIMYRPLVLGWKER